MRPSIGLLYPFLALGTLLTVLSLHFYDWPPNRDLTTYATIARELRLGEWLYRDVWDLKPPGIFVAFGLAQTLTDSGPLQFFLLRLVPSLLVLAALLRAGRDGGFGDAAGIVSGLFWVALSGNVRFQMHEANTEVFINAACVWAFVLLLRLQPTSGWGRALAIGLLYALATLFKTVALAIAGLVGLAHLAVPPSGSSRSVALRQLLWMAVGGVVGLGAVVLYFAATGRLETFREAMVDTGVEYAGNLGVNLVRALALAPLVRLPLPVGLAITSAACAAVAVLAWRDRSRRRAWVLLGAYALSALVAAGLPGKAYAHYAQLLAPPACLGLGWLLPLAAASPSRRLRLAPAAALVALLAVLAVRSTRDYLATPEERLTSASGALSLETQRLGRRLREALRPDEVLYQVGEETGLYWYSGKRPTVTWGVVQLVQWPQAERLAARTLVELPARPPALIVVANRLLPQVRGHPLFEWVETNYRPIEPLDAAERRHFTFYLPHAAEPELVRRILGSEPG